MADQHYPRDVDDEGIDDTHVREALRDLSFLRPDEPSEIDPMPDWAWARITTALAAEQSGTDARRPSRLVRWGGGLVAASVAVVAVGVGVTAFQGSGSGGAVVAGSATSGSSAPPGSGPAPAAASGAAEAGAAAADAAGASAFEAAPLTKELAATRELSFASMVPPVFRLIDSQTPYTAADLKDQVADVMASAGMPTSSTAVEEAITAPVEPVMTTDVPADGFTSTAESLRDCVTKMTQEEEATALLVDRSTFEGVSAGVIVAPEGAGEPLDSAEAVDELEVMVVDPDCNLIMKVWIGLTR